MFNNKESPTIPGFYSEKWAIFFYWPVLSHLPCRKVPIRDFFLLVFTAFMERPSCWGGGETLDYDSCIKYRFIKSSLKSCFELKRMTRLFGYFLLKIKFNA